MKLFLAVLALTCFALDVSAEEVDQLAPVRQKCATEQGLNPDQLDVATNDDSSPLHAKGQCYTSCVLNTLGVVKPDGTPDPHLVVAQIPEHLRAGALERAEKCTKSVQKVDDKCVYAHNLYKCQLAANPGIFAKLGLFAPPVQS